MDIEYNSNYREQILGFKAQKELVYTKFLPYPELADEESQKHLTQIKGYLGKAVLLKDITPGCLFWANRLQKYIRIFGLKFSKDDHLSFINLLCQLTLIPDLEPYLVHKFLTVLIDLLKKKELIAPEELTIPWRPFYDLCVRTLGTSNSTIGMYRYFSCLEGSLDNFMSVARPYFGNVTQEMWDLWKPKLCPFDGNTIHEALSFLEAFLPVHRTKLGSSGFELWFDELMQLWNTCNNTCVCWERDMMQLMAKLACSNIGHIDWEPHIPLIFTRIVRSFNLPVYYKQITSIVKPSKLEVTSIAIWIVAVLGGGSSGQKYLDQMMKSVESYLHPANTGRWSIRLKELLRKLPYFFVQRLYAEKYKVYTWEVPIPETHRLTDDDITRFVESMKPAMMTAVFSKFDVNANFSSMRYLAMLRPELIIPPLLDILNSTSDSLTEPHKYTSVMICVTTVARQLVEGNRYKEGPTHVIPLLFASLPGIDPNDVRKCFVTFQFITTLTNMIPIVDCSQASMYWHDLTPEEEIMAEATSQLEDFVLQFLDRCFVFVENSVLEITRLERDQDKRSKLENMTESVFGSTCFPLLYQMSPEIFNSALRKLHSFVSSHILETTVAGRYMASICRAFARTRPTETLKLLIPHFCHNILSLTESNDILKEEVLSNELLYNMLLLAQIADCRSTVIMQYTELLEQVLDRTLHMTSVEGSGYSSRLLTHILNSISITYPKEYRSSDQSYDKPLSEYLAIRDWGKPGTVQSLKVEWSLPGAAEVVYAQHIVSKYLPQELKLLGDDSLSLSREERFCSLQIVGALIGCGHFLPLWDEPPLLDNGTNNRVELTDFAIKTQKLPATVIMPDGSNVRKAVATTIDKLQRDLLQSAEGDVKSLKLIASIWFGLLTNMNRSPYSFDMHWKSYLVGKKMLENKLSKGKKHLRSMLIERSLLQLEMMEMCYSVMPTATHQTVMLNLLELSTSRYSEVRSAAQAKLFPTIKRFSTSYYLFFPKIIEILKSNSEENHYQFKGALYVLLGPAKFPLITRPKWNILSELWPAIVNSNPSEKLSISRLLLCIGQNVHKHFPTITINMEVPDTCNELAENLWKMSSPAPCIDLPSSEAIAAACIALKQNNEENMENYLELLNSLVDAINNSKLTWSYLNLAVSFLRDLVHPDTNYPPNIVKSFLQMLNHDFIQIRKVALRCSIFVLKQQKRVTKKQSVDPKVINKSLGYEGKEENAWLQYNSKAVPKTAEEWDKPRYIHKSYIGYNGFPKELMVYSPSHEQPSHERAWQDLSLAEQEVDDFFSNPVNVDKLIKYFSFEENKGKDKFDGFRFLLFKNLFRNFGDKHVPMFLPHLEKLVVDKQEASQRCAAELISGMIRGSKHWSFDKVEKLWSKILPLIQTGFSNMTVETVRDWGIFAATSSENRDPHRHYWLLEFLMEDPLRQDASFIDCGRLCALQGALNQNGWRVSELYYRLLEYLKPQLSHPFQIIRERIGSVLVNIFATDLPTSVSKTRGPFVKDFIKGVLPQLMCLYNIPEISNNVQKVEPMDTLENLTHMNTSMQQVSVNCKEDDKSDAIRLLKTVSKWIVNSLLTAQYSALPEFFLLLPVIAVMESYEADEELKAACKNTLATLAQSLVLPEIMPTVLVSIQEVSGLKSWWARETCLNFLQVLIFHNMSIFSSQSSWVEQTNSIVLRLLQDERHEVREKAGQVLSGLLHIGFIPNPKQLLNDLKKLATRKKRKNPNENLTQLHAGVIGLCSFISASPYDVSEPIPEIFLLLGPHLNDPQPIPATIRKTLSDFKRTHHDNWEQHKLNFTEEQLTVLTDLNMPPSYIV